MLDNFYNVSANVPNNALYRYCKDESLDYAYTVTRSRKKRRKTGKLLRAIMNLRERVVQAGEQKHYYPYSVNKVKGLKL